MTPAEAAVVAGACALAAGLAVALVRLVIPRAPAALVRTNYRDRRVPAILGIPLLGAVITSVPLVALVFSALSFVVLDESTAVVWAFVLMAVAGLWDDLRGDERPRGFKGHFGALKGRAVTGGLVKIAAGVVAGVGAAAFLPTRGASTMVHLVEVVALVGLSANLINLFDRAPGRANKVFLLIGLPLLVTSAVPWLTAFAPVVAAAAAVLAFDLREEGMLGDAGANPLGATLGVALAASLGGSGRVMAVVVLLALNLASEKWSFSKVIEATPPLRWFDGLGRRDQVAPK